MKYLLDVNVLVACIWSDHVHHGVADGWLQAKEVAVCPLSELGFLRVSTQPKAVGATLADARKLLEDFLTKHAVEFLPADLPALHSKPLKAEALTDNYLADLAARHGAKLATLDSGIKHSAVELVQ